MFLFILILVLPMPPGPAPCDSSLLAGPVQTPMSVPPTIMDQARALESIERAARSVGGIPVPAFASVWFLIDAEGRVASARIARTAGSEAADSAAIRAARSFRFRPGQFNGEPVCVWIRLPVRFRGAA